MAAVKDWIARFRLDVIDILQTPIRLEAPSGEYRSVDHDAVRAV